MNLRELLGREFASTIDETIAENTALERNHEGRVFLFHPYCNDGNCNNNYRNYCIQYWCVPCGTTQATFELWGGGGSGGGACCCMQGMPGGAGGYVRKTLEYPQIQGGWCYQLCVASTTCCSRCCCGIRGCKTWVGGCNLSNLCADGGLPGKTCCWAFWNSTYRCQDKVSWGGCGGWNLHSDGACSYGGDCMIKGKPGFFYNACDGNNCWSKGMMPYPAGLISNLGGYITQNYQGNACIHQYMYCTGTTPWAYNINCNGGPGLPGVGSPSATACGGGCCYGWRGGGGLIRITYCSCWLKSETSNEDCAWYYFN